MSNRIPSMKILAISDGRWECVYLFVFCVLRLPICSICCPSHLIMIIKACTTYDASNVYCARSVLFCYNPSLPLLRSFSALVFSWSHFYWVQSISVCLKENMTCLKDFLPSFLNYTVCVNSFKYIFLFHAFDIWDFMPWASAKEIFFIFQT